MKFTYKVEVREECGMEDVVRAWTEAEAARQGAKETPKSVGRADGMWERGVKDHLEVFSLVSGAWRCPFLRGYRQ